MKIKRLFTDMIEVSKAQMKAKRDEPITLSFIASTAAPDRYGDIIEQSGWQLASYRKNPVILFNHNPQEMPIGKGAVEVVDNALMIDIEFDMDDERAAKIARKAEKGYLNAVSVGFNPVESVPRAELPDGHFAKGVSGTYFSKAELLEVSIVTIPANSEAVAAKEYHALINKQDAISLSPEQIEKLKEFIPQLYGASSMHAKQAEYLEKLLGVEPQSRYYHDDEDSEEDTEDEEKAVDLGKKENAKEAMEALAESTQQSLKNKAKEHNDEYGDNPAKKLTNSSYLAVSYHRGLAAYNSNPESVRPSVQSAGQWAMGRVNGLLYALREGKFRRSPYDMDLLPAEHPLKKADKIYKHVLTGYKGLQRAAKETDWGFDDNTATALAEDFAQYKRAFLFVNKGGANDPGEYRLPIAKMVNDELKIVFRGVVAAGSSLRGEPKFGAGFYNLSGATLNDKKKMYSIIEKLYMDFGETAPVPPWQEKQVKQEENTNFPAMGDNEAVSLRNSKFALFPADYAANIKENYPTIWSKGGNILGNQQYTLLSRILKNNGTPETENQEEAVRLREAWAARHEKDFRLPGVVAQMKWYVVGSRGLDHMKQVIETEIEKIDKTFGDLPKTKEVNGDLEALFAVLKDIIKE